MTPTARQLIIAAATLFSLAGSEAQAGSWERPLYWDGPPAYCRIEPSRRGYGPTLEYIFVNRCYYADGMPLRPYRTRVHVLRARG